MAVETLNFRFLQAWPLISWIESLGEKRTQFKLKLAGFHAKTWAQEWEESEGMALYGSWQHNKVKENLEECKGMVG